MGRLERRKTQRRRLKEPTSLHPWTDLGHDVTDIPQHMAIFPSKCLRRSSLLTSNRVSCWKIRGTMLKSAISETFLLIVG
jgi:hypothetical protein